MHDADVDDAELFREVGVGEVRDVVEADERVVEAPDEVELEVRVVALALEPAEIVHKLRDALGFEPAAGCRHGDEPRPDRRRLLRRDVFDPRELVLRDSMQVRDASDSFLHQYAAVRV